MPETPTRRRRNAPKPEAIEPVLSERVPEENSQEETVSVTEAETTENASAEAPAKAPAEATERKPGRKPMSEADRQRRATYRACEAASKLLAENGFKVTAPEGWENPEVDKLREAASRAIQALRDAGIDPTAVVNGTPQE